MASKLTKAAAARALTQSWQPAAAAAAARGAVIPSLPKAPRILGSSAKVRKGGRDYAVRIVYLTPANGAVPTINLCPNAGACKGFCLALFAGRMIQRGNGNARLWKTLCWLFAREAFEALLLAEIDSFAASCAKNGSTPVIRFDGGSDTGYGRLLAAKRPQVLFYDYTKSTARMRAFLAGRMPKNYHLTYSVSEAAGSVDFAQTVLAAGGIAAVVFAGDRPAEWNGYPVIDGDGDDWRFAQKPGTVCGLKFKAAKAPETATCKAREAGFAV